MRKLIKRIFTIDNMKKFGKALSIIGTAMVKLSVALA